jgi:uncharacterized phiE125 gp8 family phage protein
MALSQVTAPALEPVTLAETKTHLRVDDFSEDELIDSLRVAAREFVENFTSRKLITQTWDLKLDAFPVRVPRVAVCAGDVGHVDHLLDTAGVSQTWSSANYTVDAPSGPFAMPGRITPAYGVVWPSTQNVINAVTVRFVVGYGATPWTVPYLLGPRSRCWSATGTRIVSRWRSGRSRATSRSRCSRCSGASSSHADRWRVARSSHGAAADERR